MDQCQRLVQQFALPGLNFEPGEGGLIRASIQTPVASGELYLNGAHVTQWQPAEQRPVLWLSRSSYFETGKPIRGGVPICFPWFGPHPTDSHLPAHGRARITAWEVESTEVTPTGGIGMRLSTQMENFALRFHVVFDRDLQMTLEVQAVDRNVGLLRFEEALHTYLAIGDIRDVEIQGLEQCRYVDKMDGAATKSATGVPIEFDSETDRVYFDTQANCRLIDRRGDRVICVEKSGSLSTVVWNPWIAKSARMPDFGDEEWPGMVCIETANVGTNAVELKPGQTHSMQVRISVEATGTLA